MHPSEIEISHLYFPSKRGQRKVALTISMEALVDVLATEMALLKPEDIPRFLGTLHARAAVQGCSDQEALDEWDGVVSEMESDADVDTG